MKINIKKSGFTLAEMLVVMLIISIIAAASVPLAHKRFKVKKDKVVHGKYECFYKDVSGTPTLWERRFSSGRQIFDRAAVGGECHFEPEEKATFYIVQAIGGGGGGAHSGDVPAREGSYTHSSTYYIPYTTVNGITKYDGQIKTDFDTQPSWMATDLQTKAITTTITVYSGGGGGGLGNIGGYTVGGAMTNWIQPDAAYNATTCTTESGRTPAPYSNNYAHCMWTYKTPYTGGRGGYGTQSTCATTFRLGQTIQAWSGAAGTGATYSSTTATAGGSSYVYSNSAASPCAASTVNGGTAGGNATTSANGTAGTPTTVTAVSGGTGGTGMYNFGTGEPVSDPAYYFASGNNGGSSNTSATTSSVAYTITYYTQKLAYGDGGSAGEYKNLFFTKLKSGMDISIGTGGAAGTNATNYAGSSGTNTTFGEMVAEGGTGGQNKNLTAAIDIFKMVNNSDYRTQILGSDSVTYSAYNITRAGLIGQSGAFMPVYEVQSGSSETITTDTDLGAGGNGGGSTACMGYSTTHTISGTGYSHTVGDSGCTSSNNPTYTAPTAGKNGALVIIW